MKKLSVETQLWAFLFCVIAGILGFIVGWIR